jgi:hypothetical protein
MSTSEELAVMLDAALSAVDNLNVTDGTATTADECVQSLLKSMAQLGFDRVREGKQ